MSDKNEPERSSELYEAVSQMLDEQRALRVESDAVLRQARASQAAASVATDRLQSGPSRSRRAQRMMRLLVWFALFLGAAGALIAIALVLPRWSTAGSLVLASLGTVVAKFVMEARDRG
jgi:hypothetical protein